MSLPYQYTTPQVQYYPGQVPGEPSCTDSTDASSSNPLAQQSSLKPDSLTLYFKFSRAWLQAAAVDLLTDFPSPIVPAISPDYIYHPPTSQYPLYVPRALWNVRCLSPQERHELYIEFCVFGHTMQRHGLGTPEYNSAFGLVVEKSSDISNKERQWYAQFTGPQETHAQRTRDYRAIVTQQAQPVDIRVTSSGGRPGDSIMTAVVIDEENGLSTTLHGHKRCASSSYLEADHRPAKKVAREVDEAVREQRAAKAEADHRRYLEQKQIIDEHYLKGDSSRKPTDPEWQKLAVFDCDRAAQKTSLSTKKRRQSTPKQAAGSYADIVACPKLPSRNLASYPMKTATTYMCLHLDCACRGTEDCTVRTHDCCRKGLSLRELEIAVKRQHERACARIEELAFRDGKLDRRHKTWEDWFSKDMRTRDSSRAKAHVPPLGWEYDPRSSPASSSQGDVPSPQPFAVQQPLQLEQRRQRKSPVPQPISIQVGEGNALLPNKAPELPHTTIEAPKTKVTPSAQHCEGDKDSQYQEFDDSEQPHGESAVQDDDALLSALVAAFEEDNNALEWNAEAADLEKVGDLNGGLDLAPTGVQLQKDMSNKDISSSLNDSDDDLFGDLFGDLF